MIVELDKIIYEEKNEVGYIMINDPPANKMTPQFFQDMIEIVEKYIDDSRLKGIIIYGKGRHFSSGADVDKLVEVIGKTTPIDESGNVIGYAEWYIKFIQVFERINKLGIPVISAITGCCLGSGFELVLSSHIRVCGKGATLGLPESTFGMLPGVLGTVRLSELLGISVAMEFVFTGKLLKAEEAAEYGIVQAIVEKKETLSYAEGLLEFIIGTNERYNKTDIKQYIEKFEIGRREA